VWRAEIKLITRQLSGSLKYSLFYRIVHVY